MQPKQIKLSLLANEPQKIAAIFVFFLTFFLFMWELIAVFQFAEKKPLVPLANTMPEKTSLSDDSPLFTTRLFGTYVSQNLTDADIKQSMLDAEVVGILFSAREDESQAIIQVGGGRQKTYVVGDILPGGTIIKRIMEKGVVVLHKEALESLSLPKNELIFEAPAKLLIKE
jgi:general secretion pathway protein C